MTGLDYLLFGLYMAGLLGIGLYFFRRNENHEDYYVGGRTMSAPHIGLSIVATDVGGGFSIGLGGLGYAIGLSGSWLLFTGLLGAWLSAVFIIPRIKRIDRAEGLLTYPDFLRHRYGGGVAALAAAISAIGYLGFTAAQVLAGAKLMAGTVMPAQVAGIDGLSFSIGLIGLLIMAYTVLGGIKAVIYTDMVQWFVLLAGLILAAIPMALIKIGGWSALRAALPPSFFSLTQVGPVRLINWMAAIVPIWLVGMTLYQRMYACRNEKEARRAWYLAGVLEYPVMAFAGVFLGMCGRALFAAVDPEMAVPMLIKTVLPAGLAGLVAASYFSAVMSTADSCLMATSGHIVSDLIQRVRRIPLPGAQAIRLSQGVTLVLGLAAIALAGSFTMVLDGILHAYTFMVSGLFVPTFGAFFWKKRSRRGALAGMLAGGGLALALTLWPHSLWMGLDPAVYGILLSAIAFITVSLACPDRPAEENRPDAVEWLDGARIQHGPSNQRIYVMSLRRGAGPTVLPLLDRLAREHRYTKIFAKVPETDRNAFAQHGYREEACIPGFFRDGLSVYFMGCYLDPRRAEDPHRAELEAVVKTALARGPRTEAPVLPAGYRLAEARPEDAERLAALYAQVFASYPFPIHDPAFLRKTMAEHTAYFLVFHGDALVAAASAEITPEDGAAEMTDFATRPDDRGRGLAGALLNAMEHAMAARGLQTVYTIARAPSQGMNMAFARAGYAFGGTLVRNTQIGGHIESMNVWHKALKASPSTDPTC